MSNHNYSDVSMSSNSDIPDLPPVPALVDDNPGMPRPQRYFVLNLNTGNRYTNEPEEQEDPEDIVDLDEPEEEEVTEIPMVEIEEEEVTEIPVVEVEDGNQEIGDFDMCHFKHHFGNSRQMGYDSCITDTNRPGLRCDVFKIPGEQRVIGLYRETSGDQEVSMSWFESNPH